MESRESDMETERPALRKATSPERILALWDLLCRHTSSEPEEGIALAAAAWDDAPQAPEDILTILETEYGLLVSKDQYESAHAYDNALQRLRTDLVTLNRLFARRDTINDPHGKPRRTVFTRALGQGRFTYHVDRPFSREEVFIIADALAHSRLADMTVKNRLQEKVKELHYTREHPTVEPCMSYRPKAEASKALLETYGTVAKVVQRLDAMGSRRDGLLAPISLIYGTLGPDLDLVAQPLPDGSLRRLLLPLAVHEDHGKYYMSARIVTLEDDPEGPRYVVFNDRYLNFRLDRVIPHSIEDWADEDFPGLLPYRLTDPQPGMRAGLTEHERYTLETSYEMYASSDPLTLILDAEGSVLKAIADSFDPESEDSPLAKKNSVRVLPDGRTRVAVPVANGAALMGRLASFGNEAQVVGDRPLKEAYVSFLLDMLTPYAHDPEVGTIIRERAAQLVGTQD